MNFHISYWLADNILTKTVWRCINTICFIQTIKGFILLPDKSKREEMVDVLETRRVDMKRQDQIKPIRNLQLTKIYNLLQYYINTLK